MVSPPFSIKKGYTMKNLIVSILLCFATPLFSQESSAKILTMGVPCDKTQNVFNILQEGKEGLLFSGGGLIAESTTRQVYPTATMVFVNQETGNWSVIASFGDGTSCLIMPGKNFTPYSGKQPWDEEKDEL